MMVPFRDDHTDLRNYRPCIGTPAEHRALRLLVLGSFFLICFLLGFLSGTVYAAEPRVALQVRPQVMLPMTRRDVDVQMRVPRHADNRLLVLTWDGGPSGQGGAAYRDLEGDASPALFTDRLRELPAAPYVFVAAVYDSRGQLTGRAVADIRLVGEDGQ